MNNKQVRIFLLLLFFFYCGLNGPVDVSAQHESTGFLLTDDQGHILLQKNTDKKFIPASILKILTSLCAIKILGETYHFPTEYAFDPGSKNLYLKGYGDPLFISESIRQLSIEIRTKINTNFIRNIICDDSYFNETIIVPGKGRSLNPYDAPVGALCANFNTVSFKWNVTAKKFISAEHQTPLLDIFEDKIKATGLKTGRIVFSKDEGRLYPGLLLKHFLNENGLPVKGKVRTGEFSNAGHREGHTFLSPFSLKDVIQKLLEYSNNFMANQLLLAVGARCYGAPATLEKGINALTTYLNQNLTLGNVSIAEGSGLSRTNQITPLQMTKILHHFKPYASLLRQGEKDLYKTGTLTGVRSRAGFLIGKNNRLYPYVIIVNQHNTGYENLYKKFVIHIARQ